MALQRLSAQAVRQILGPMDRSEVVALALLSGFAEEVFFRGALQGAWGWVPATILCAALHTGPGPTFRVWTLFAGIAGLAFAWLTIWRGNLLPAIVAHMLVNGVNRARISRVRGAGGHGEAGGEGEKG